MMLEMREGWRTWLVPRCPAEAFAPISEAGHGG